MSFEVLLEKWKKTIKGFWEPFGKDEVDPCYNSFARVVSFLTYILLNLRAMIIPSFLWTWLHGNILLDYVLQEINQIIVDIDKYGSAAIDFDEFVYMMTAKIGEKDTMEELSKALCIIDHDNNGSFCWFILDVSHSYWWVTI